MRLLTALLAAVALALAAAAGAGAAPVAAVQDDQLPNFTGADLERRLDLLAESGADVARVDVLWSQVAPRRPSNAENPNDAAYDWGRYDQIVRGLAARGIIPLFDYYDTPRWAARGGNGSTAPRAADAGRFAGAMALRYSGRWPDPQGGLLPEVRFIEVWNEPNITRFLSPQCTPRRGGRAPYVAPRLYAAMLAAAYRRIKRANPRAVVIAGVAGPAGSTPRFCPESGASTGVIEFINGLAKERPPFDAWSQHAYPIGSPKQAVFLPSWNTLPRIQRAVDRIRRVPIYVTETGYHTSYNRFHRYFVSEEQQAAWLDETFEAAETRPRVELVTWFNLQDNPSWTGGLIRGDGTRKPSWDRFVSASARYPAPPAWSAP